MPNAATRDQVMESPTPDPTATHFPVPHRTMIETIEKHIVSNGFTVEREEYGLWQDGMRMFGAWCLGHPAHTEKDWRLAIGLRNAHDKAFSASFGVGERTCSSATTSRSTPRSWSCASTPGTCCATSTA